MCSKPPPPTEEVARLQGSPLAPSKIGLFNKPNSSRRNTTDGVPTAGKVGAAEPSIHTVGCRAAGAALRTGGVRESHSEPYDSRGDNLKQSVLMKLNGLSGPGAGCLGAAGLPAYRNGLLGSERRRADESMYQHGTACTMHSALPSCAGPALPCPALRSVSCLTLPCALWPLRLVGCPQKGAPAVDPAFPGPAPLAPMYGPFLRYGGYDPPSRTYRLSVLAVVHQTKSPYAPHLRYRCAGVHGRGPSTHANQTAAAI